MNKKYILPGLFIVVAIIQLWIPINMIVKSKAILDEGKAFRFKTAPIDPVDPFRGKYITLAFDIDEHIVSEDTTWQRNDVALVLIGTDKDGFAEIRSVTKVSPEKATDYFQTSIRYVWRDSLKTKIAVRFPFNSFYMEESKAQDAEIAVRDITRDSTQHAYAVVRIKEGEARLQDVIVNDMPIKEWVEKLKAEKQ